MIDRDYKLDIEAYKPDSKFNLLTSFLIFSQWLQIIINKLKTILEAN